MYYDDPTKPVIGFELLGETLLMQTETESWDSRTLGLANRSLILIVQSQSLRRSCMFMHVDGGEKLSYQPGKTGKT